MLYQSVCQEALLLTKLTYTHLYAGQVRRFEGTEPAMLRKIKWVSNMSTSRAKHTSSRAAGLLPRGLQAHADICLYSCIVFPFPIVSLKQTINTPPYIYYTICLDQIVCHFMLYYRHGDPNLNSQLQAQSRAVSKTGFRDHLMQ